MRGIQLEGKNLLLEVQSSTYAPLSAARNAYLEAMDSGLLCTSRRADVPALLGGSLCAATIVLTADQRILTTQRSARVSRARSFSLALGEVLEPQDVQEGGDFVRGVCARTLEQELGLTLTREQRASCLKPLHLLVTHDTGEWVFLVVADFRGLGAPFSAARILQNAPLAVDAWETENRSSEAYSEASLRAFLAAHAGNLAFWAEGLVELLLEELPPSPEHSESAPACCCPKKNPRP